MNSYSKCVENKPVVKVQKEEVSQQQKRQIGLIIGKFDPVHNAQLLAAQQVMCKLNLDEIWFAAAGNDCAASFHDRICMLELATHTNRAFKVNAFELLHKGPAYVTDVLEYLQQKWSANRYYLIMGSDQISQLPTWRKPDVLARIATLVGVQRPNYPVKAQYPLIWVDVPAFDISGTAVRQAYRTGGSLRYLVPDPVIEYLQKKGLYHD
ncbi:nicotinate (nicotinamide) nucleotide adenylyltransferase [Lactobacillus sp. ESL0791]|uniref:nicotinate (nicotinamide) nucleotide adenylyltransferase n=1 Tax=Lactobacillus sp. ESL0791 TaxID=2983234 RepID=UPI0023F6D2DD|nr:nicotinate (nicotinamide) nucleotide adenylyltransferase [Lactobacillus sp. ESL0791]MDF7639167.1 nicotinate (nicotinamide) nucleotide adenylyltransferase [Lactobacillus sp. ESL0791]